MSTSFSPSLVTGHGISGQISATLVANAVSTLSSTCQLAYNQDTKIFTILNSQDIPADKVSEAFLKYSFFGWAPKIKKSSDVNGNLQVKLIPIDIYTPERGVASRLYRLSRVGELDPLQK